jgi:hypothetical protein
MSPVQGLVALIAEIGDLYERKTLVTENNTTTECEMLREWSTVIKRKDALCMLDAELLDGILARLWPILLRNWMSIQFDDSVDAIFAKGSNIIATVHLHQVQGEFEDDVNRIRQNDFKTKMRLDEILKRMCLIEKKLESDAENVLDYKKLQHINLLVSMELHVLQAEIGNLSKNIGNIQCVNVLHRVCADLCKIQERLSLDKEPIGGIRSTGTSRCTRLELVDLLGRLNIGYQTVNPTQYSLESEHVLWDSNDRVRDAFYVTLRHFNGEIIGNHVALRNEDIRKFPWGERRSYRLPPGTCTDEHLTVYLYNPAVNDNGILSVTVNTTDRQSTGMPHTTCVEPDTCPVVLKFALASMTHGHVTDLCIKNRPYRISLCITFPPRRQYYTKHTIIV